ncbi:hypothetical protein JTB14_014143 [Gonioctena quinquepunctata]|nr:hypothetical protein JTB14_014143 [Gonioctena quinquepunctata]
MIDPGFDGSDEDELFFPMPQPRRPKLIRERVNYYEMLNDDQFFMIFRLKTETIDILLGTIQEDIQCRTERNSPIPVMTRLSMTLRFYATGSFYIVCGDFCHVSKTTAFTITQKVTEILALMRPLFINMPQTEEEIATVRLQFYNKARVPKVVGVIDGTHIRLQSPESKVVVLDMLASIDVNDFVQVELLVNDETGEMGVVVKQVGGYDEAVEDGGVPAAADVIEDLASRFQDLTMEQTDGCAVCYTITFVVLQTIEESVKKLCTLCFNLYTTRHRQADVVYRHIDVHTTCGYGEMTHDYCRVWATYRYLVDVHVILQQLEQYQYFIGIDAMVNTGGVPEEPAADAVVTLIVDTRD